MEEQPRLADGVELLGEFRDSGFKEPPSLVQREDGQVLQLPRLLYLVAESLDGRHTSAEIASRVSEATGRGLDADGVAFLVAERLAPLGLVEGLVPEELVRADPMLALRLRAAVVPSRVVRTVARALSPLFLPIIVVGVLAGVAALDVWVFAVHGLAQAVQAVLAQPLLLLILLALVIASAVFHESGHAAACHYGGARPGPMGVGLYLVWPAFYTDVTDAYRLGRRDRLRTDLGGVYFNCVFMLGCGLAYLATGFTPLLLFIPIQHLEIAHQLLPVLRLDGYLIVSDLAGVPDILSRIKPTLASLLPGRRADTAIESLKRGPRIAVTAYILTVLPLFLAAFGLMLLSAPRILATAAHSFAAQLHVATHAFAHGDATLGIVTGVGMTVLALPSAGLVVGVGRVGRRIAKAGWRRGPLPRATTVLGFAAVAAALGFAWWPHTEFRPVRSGERGTLQAGFERLGSLLGSLPSPSGGSKPTPPRPTAGESTNDASAAAMTTVTSTATPATTETSTSTSRAATTPPKHMRPSRPFPAAKASRTVTSPPTSTTWPTTMETSTVGTTDSPTTSTDTTGTTTTTDTTSTDASTTDTTPTTTTTATTSP
jgi:putative peptide zinc metalloprotease protein